MISAADLAAFRHVAIEDWLVPVLAQLAVILLAARFMARVARRLGQPEVIGEIAAGLLLGPSFFQWLAPGAWEWLFHPSVANLPHELSDPIFGKILAVLSELGLLLLLFLVGMEFDFSHLRRDGRAAAGIAVVGIAAPFFLGLLLAVSMHSFLEPHPDIVAPVPEVGFALFLGTALAITAIPVLARIMMELSMTRTRLAAITITAAAMNDAAGWVLLASVTAAVRAGFQPARAIAMTGELLAFTAGMLLVVRPIMRHWARRIARRGRFGHGELAVLLAALFACSLVAGSIGTFAIFGAFLLGAVLSPEREFCALVRARLHDIVMGLLLPIFFASTGLKTNIGSLGSWQMAGWAGAIVLVAAAAKIGGCTVAARVGGFSLRESACIGALMNTRGLMELVVANIGYEWRVIPPSIYCTLVFMALATSVMTTPLVRRLAPGTELEPCLRKPADRSPALGERHDAPKIVEA